MIENSSITPNIIEGVFKETHIFNNIVLLLKPHVIKTSPKSDIVVVWIDIWDLQNGLATKNIINQYFNVKQYIVTICSTNINPGIL